MKEATLAQGNQVLTLILQKRVPCVRLQALLSSGLLSDLLMADVGPVDRGKFREFLGVTDYVEQNFSVKVDCTRSLVQMIKAGKYEWVNNGITAEHFSIEGEGTQEKEVVLFHFNKVMTSDNVITEMKKQGFRPARIEELLALGEFHPDVQRQFPVVALGSAWPDPESNRGIPYLSWDGFGSSLDLNWFGHEWRGGCRFLAVRK